MKFSFYLLYIGLLVLCLPAKNSNGFFFNWRSIQSVLNQFSSRTRQFNSFGAAVQQSFPSRTSDSDTIETLESNLVGVTAQGQPGSIGSTKCFEEIGCIEITDEWFDLFHRPVNWLPHDRARINIRYILYTRERVTDPIQVFLNKTNLLESGFQPNKPVKFVVHGFFDSGFANWVVKLSQQLTTNADVNVIAVDWFGGSLTYYTQATANTRVVGLEIAYFIKFLMKEFNISPGNVHILGHSLGAHVAGYAGEKTPGLGRISGLDPAEPYFQYMPTFVRLDPSDAKFVDVIHTDGKTILLLGFGMIQPCGHVDFYPNDGQEQPGCKITQRNLLNMYGLDDLEREIFACNHHRAVYYFIESLLSKCHYVGHICKNYDSYLMGQCYSCGEDGSYCARMGIDADKYSVNGRSLIPFYLTTGKASPFCVYHYRVNIQLAYPRQAKLWVTGKLKISIIGALGSNNTFNLSPTDNLKIRHGSNLTFIVQNSKEFSAIEQIQINWKFTNDYMDNIKSSCLSFKCKSNMLFVERVEIFDIDDMHIRQDKTNQISNTICGEKGKKYTMITSGTSVSLGRKC